MVVRIRKCLQCGSEFKPHTTSVKNGKGKFCGRKCWGKYRHNENLHYKECLFCGAVFRGIKKRKVCSQGCAARLMAHQNKNRDTYDGKIKIRTISDKESIILKMIRDMPEMESKITDILKARKTMKNVYGRFINERVRDDI